MKTFDQLIITTGFLASASPAMADEKPEADSGRPNILFILSDDHTSQAWGIYGGILSEYVKNENIRRLAAEHGIPVPVNDWLYEQVQEMERAY